jgi:hypothetical protein
MQHLLVMTNVCAVDRPLFLICSYTHTHTHTHTHTRSHRLRFETHVTSSTFVIKRSFVLEILAFVVILFSGLQ